MWSGSKNAPCPCGDFELLSSSPAPALRAVEFFEATKKSFKIFFSEPLLNIEITAATPPPHTIAQAINLLRSPTGERIKFFSPSGSTRNTLGIPGAYPLCPCDALTPARRGPCRGLGSLWSGSKNAPCLCGVFEPLRSPLDPALRAVELFEATKKSVNCFFLSPS